MVWTRKNCGNRRIKIRNQSSIIINLSLETGVVPSDWKVAKVIPLYKSGSQAAEIDNYRSISITSHSIMLSKMSRYGVSNTELQWLTDYLFLRKQIVHFNGVLSEPNSINTGVPQGSILGPLLFLIFFNDVHSPLRHCKSLTYADDTVIFTSSNDIDAIQDSLSQDLDNLSNWSRDNELIYNLKKGKSKMMLFGTGKRLNLLQGCQVKLSVNGAPINTTTCYKYLGVHLDPTLNFETHFQKIHRKAAGKVNLLWCIRCNIDSFSAQRIYQSMIMPIFTYCGYISLGWSKSRKRMICYIEA